MQVTLFRPSHRQKWMAWLREKGWRVRHVYEVGKVTSKVVVVDSASKNWDKFAVYFSQKGMAVYLLSDGQQLWDPSKLLDVGIVRVITIEEEPVVKDVSETEENHEALVPLEVDIQRTEVQLPLSVRWKQKDQQSVIFKQVEDHIQEKGVEREPMGSLSKEEDIPETGKLVVQEMPIMNVKRHTGSTLKFPSVVTVYSAKGGVGKTVFLLNLAALLAKHSLKVCILDLDLQHGTVASTLHIQPKITITDLNSRIENPKASRACLIHTEMGFSIVAAPSDVMFPVLTQEQVIAILQFLKSEMDLVLIDTSVHFDLVTKVAMEQAGQLFLMTTQDEASLDNLARMKPLLSSLLPLPEMSVLMNRVNKLAVREDLLNILPWPVVKELPHDPLVADAVRKGECVVVHHSRNPYCLQLETLVDSWLGVQPDELNKSKNPVATILDVFRKMSSK